MHSDRVDGRIKWHYTTGQRFFQIVSDGEIRPATAFVPEGERTIVWFSTNEEWEPTANKAWIKADGSRVPQDRDGTAERGGGLVRIGVAPETAAYDWNALKQLSGMSSKMASGLYRAAIDQRARPADWWGTFETVSRDKWKAVEVWHEGRWVSVPLDT
jgi:hypothetical protein